MKIAYIDLEQAESRAVGAICYRLFGDSTYLDAQESGDPHTLVCSMCWDKLPWPADFNLAALAASGRKTFPPDILAAAKHIAGGNAYREMSYRDLAKRLGHGSNYGGQPLTMAKHTHVKTPTVARFQDAYFSAFPALKRWHRWVQEQLETTRIITTMLGRRRMFYGRPDDAATLREAIAYEPQSVATGDYMNAGMLAVWRAHLPLHLNKQVHDAIAISYDERDEHWLIPEACRLIEWEFDLTPHPDQITKFQQKTKLIKRDRDTLEKLLTLPPRPFSIPTEALVGWNLSYRKVKKDNQGSVIKVLNPNGLIKFNPDKQDERRRIATRPIDATEILPTTARGFLT